MQASYQDESGNAKKRERESESTDEDSRPHLLLMNYTPQSFDEVHVLKLTSCLGCDRGPVLLHLAMQAFDHTVLCVSSSPCDCAALSLDAIALTTASTPGSSSSFRLDVCE